MFMLHAGMKTMQDACNFRGFSVKKAVPFIKKQNDSFVSYV